MAAAATKSKAEQDKPLSVPPAAVSAACAQEVLLSVTKLPSAPTSFLKSSAPPPVSAPVPGGDKAGSGRKEEEKLAASQQLPAVASANGPANPSRTGGGGSGGAGIALLPQCSRRACVTYVVGEALRCARRRWSSAYECPLIDQATLWVYHKGAELENEQLCCCCCCWRQARAARRSISGSSPPSCRQPAALQCTPCKPSRCIWMSAKRTSARRRH